MKSVSIDKLEIGMVIAEDVRNAQNMLLAPAGLEVGEQHLRTFKTWGITKVKVESDGDEDESSLSPEVLAEINSKVEHMLRFNPDSPEKTKLTEIARNSLIDIMEKQ